VSEDHPSAAHTPLKTERTYEMLGSVVELLGGMFFSALTLLIGSCIVGSIVAALRAVGGET